MKTLPRAQRGGAQPKLLNFGNWVSKIMLDQQKFLGFRKSKESAKSLHPTVQYIYCDINFNNTVF